MSARRNIEYRVIITPSVEHLRGCGKLLVGVEEMAAFLGLPKTKVRQLEGTERIPLPVRLGRCPRWSVLELLEWVEAGCPRCLQWIEQRGWSGSVRRTTHGPPRW